MIQQRQFVERLLWITKVRATESQDTHALFVTRPSERRSPVSSVASRAAHGVCSAFSTQASHTFPLADVSGRIVHVDRHFCCCYCCFSDSVATDFSFFF